MKITGEALKPMKRRTEGLYAEFSLRTTLSIIGAVCVLAAGSPVATSGLRAQGQQIAWSEQERPLAQELHRLRSLPDDERARDPTTGS
jgi:hypothetical protein